VQRRADEHARALRLRQHVGHVGREQRPRGMDAHVLEQRQQHGELDAVHVVRRHRAHDRHRHVFADGQRAADGGGIERGIARQRAPALGMRLRLPGAAGSEAHQHHVIGAGLQFGCRCRVRLRRSAPAAHVLVGDGQVVRICGAHFGQCDLAAGHGHELHAALEQRRGERQQEGLALLAQVQQVRRGRDLRGDPRRVAQEVAAPQRRSIAPQEHVALRAAGFGHQHRPPLTAMTWRVT
jgi:hypothetical protein